MEKIKDYIVHDKYYLRVKDTDNIEGEPQLLGSSWDNKNYFISVNGKLVEMNRYYGANDPKTAILRMYQTASTPIKGLTTVILDYIFNDLNLDHKYVMSNLTKLSNVFLNSLNNMSYEEDVFRENLRLFDNFKEIKEWLTEERIRKLIEHDKTRKLYIKALNNKIDCF